MIRGFHHSSRFRASFRKLDRNTRMEVIEELKHFAIDPAQPQYRVHRLRKNLSGWLSLAISHDLLIIFKFTKKDNSEILLDSVGTHEIYKD